MTHKVKIFTIWTPKNCIFDSDHSHRYLLNFWAACEDSSVIARSLDQNRLITFVCFAS